MSGLYIPDLEIPENCIGCNYRDPSYGNCCELMIDNPSDSFEEQYRLCPIRKLCENAIPFENVQTIRKGTWLLNALESVATCSECECSVPTLWKDPDVYWNYCPNCGAYMRCVDEEKRDIQERLNRWGVAP